MKKVHYWHEGKGLVACGADSKSHKTPREILKSQDINTVTCLRCLDSTKRWASFAKNFIGAMNAVSEGFVKANQVRQEMGFNPVCKIDQKPIVMMVMTGTDYCSQNCREQGEAK